MKDKDDDLEKCFLLALLNDGKKVELVKWEGSVDIYAVSVPKDIKKLLMKKIEEYKSNKKK